MNQTNTGGKPESTPTATESPDVEARVVAIRSEIVGAMPWYDDSQPNYNEVDEILRRELSFTHLEGIMRHVGLKVEDLWNAVAQNDGFAHLTAKQPDWPVLVDLKSGEEPLRPTVVTWDYEHKVLIIEVD